ncbi:MAG: hypothetical protein ACFFCS_17125 [Candidatus Hodarchaeota archaeon]
MQRSIISAKWWLQVQDRDGLLAKKSFRISKYITLKLIGRYTIIFVAGMPFEQCKYLLLHITPSNASDYDEIGSIDEAAEKLDHTLEPFFDTWDVTEERNRIITPEEEFWGHCSNIQAWVENDYDTRILHSNLAFPLLQRLAELGDDTARRVFKKEIMDRAKSGYEPTIEYLIEAGFMDHLSNDEISELVLDLVEKGHYIVVLKILDDARLVDYDPHEIVMEVLTKKFHELPEFRIQEMYRKIFLGKSLYLAVDIEGYSGVKPSPAFIQGLYQKLMGLALISKMELVYEITGLKVDCQEEIVEYTYKILLDDEIPFTQLMILADLTGFMPGEEIVQEAHDRALKSGNKVEQRVIEAYFPIKLEGFYDRLFSSIEVKKHELYHLQKLASGPEQKDYTCIYCRVRFKTIYLLSRHYEKGKCFNVTGNPEKTGILGEIVRIFGIQPLEEAFNERGFDPGKIPL